MIDRRWVWPVAFAALSAAGGCSPPNAANTLLRKENQTLTSQVQTLQTQTAGLEAQLQANAGPTTQRLPQSRLDNLFTVHGLTFGRLTGGYSPDNGPDQMVKVYVVPTDDDGEPLKAAGGFVVELFDLAAQNTRLGRWEFTTSQARADWYGHALLYTYVLDCPWQTKPRHENLSVKVTFTDALTGRTFNAEKTLTVHPPPAPG